MEIWKDISTHKDYYEVSNLGRVRNKKTNKFLKIHINTSGYYFICLHYKKRRTVSIHILLAEAFLNHKSNGFKIVVDHIDNNKLNNDLSNLQLISNRRNSIKDKKPKSGHSCIYYNNKSWLVRMRINGIKKTFGTFKNINDAIVKRDKVIGIYE